MEDSQLLLNPTKLADITRHLQTDRQAIVSKIIVVMRDSLNVGLSDVFMAGTIAMLFAVLMVFFLKEIPLRENTMQPRLKKSRNG